MVLKWKKNDRKRNGEGGKRWPSRAVQVGAPRGRHPLRRQGGGRPQAEVNALPKDQRSESWLWLLTCSAFAPGKRSVLSTGCPGLLPRSLSLVRFPS